MQVLDDASVTSSDIDFPSSGEASPLQAPRICDWCRGPIPDDARSDSICCSVRCRQARHRFKSTMRATAPATRPLRLAYADPPYPTMSKRYYSDHPDYDGEVDHEELVARLVTEYPDGWALSTSAAALPVVLASCPPGTRVAAWVRGERPTRSWGPLNAWEPVIYHGGRAHLHDPSHESARRIDALVHHARPRTTDPNRVVGAKPAAFCAWLFDLLGAQPGDTLDDLFPGSGGVTRAWRYYCDHAVDPSCSTTVELDASRTAAALHDASPRDHTDG